MLVHLTTAYDTPWSCMRELREAASQDRFRQHVLTDIAAEADVILFADARHDLDDWRFNKIRSHPLARQYSDRCFVYCIMDQPWCGMQGLYTSMPRQSFSRARQRACSYVGVMNQFVPPDRGATPDPKWLFSFVGRGGARCRAEILQLRHPRGFIEDTSSCNFFGEDGPEHQRRREVYARSLFDSKFVLCPRGAGTSSYRLFETMAAGRVPVIISDDWVPIDGPDWSACSIRVRENNVSNIPSLLEQYEQSWPPTAAAAAKAWHEYFAPDVIWHRLVMSCIELKSKQLNARKGWPQLNIDGRYWRLKLRYIRAGLFKSSASVEQQI